ncbi:MAG: hypothetical protein GF329_17045 [Candidatus Lokiarchaeota archaeon]|nr:hypothetical protein [Candidatus Lokiarchaeota archaeon]
MTNKLKLGSLSWAEEFVKRINKNEDYLEYAKDLNSSFNLHVTQEGETFLSFNWVGVNGKATQLSEGLNEDAEFTLEGPKDVWMRIVKGELNFMDAVQKKLITIRGPLPKLMRFLPATTEMIRVVESMDEITDYDV